MLIAIIFAINAISIILAQRSSLRKLLPKAFITVPAAPPAVILSPAFPSAYLPCHEQEISCLTITSGFLAVFDTLFRTGWVQSAINNASEDNPTARANGRTAFNALFLIIFMNTM